MRSAVFILLALSASAQDSCGIKEFFSPNSGFCLLKKGPGDYCNVVQTCMPPGECVSERCVGAIEPPLPGVMAGVHRPKIILANDIDYPPYAFLEIPPQGDYTVGGFGADFAKGLESVCDIDVVISQIGWADCWDSGVIGTGLKYGEVHGCATYTHTQGVRNRFLEFTGGILQQNKAAGILVRLDAQGNPELDGTSNLDGKIVVDVVGWAPTADTLALSTNKCTGEKFAGFTIIDPDATTPGKPNDQALATLLNSNADAVWIYADQAEHYVHGCENPSAVDDWDCSLWNQFGTNFAYVQTGLKEFAVNGTTLAISKKGSGLKSILDPCIDLFLETEDYYTLCQKHGLTASCYPNTFFSADLIPEKAVYQFPTNEITTECSTGYCACPV